MALPVNIESLVNHRIVESTRLEFKKSFNPDAVIRSICAFANDIDNIGGGYIVLGIEEEAGAVKYPIVGLEKRNIDAVLKKLREYCHFIEPLYEPVVEPVCFNGAHLVVIWVPGGYGRPYRAPKSVLSNQSQKYYFIRKFSSSVIASREEEKELFYASMDIPFDDRPHLGVGIDALDLGLIREHLKAVGSSMNLDDSVLDLRRVAENMRLLGGVPEALSPLNVGLLMFCEHPEKYFPMARIEIVDIPDPSGTGMVEKIFTGPIQRQLKDALAYIQNYVIKTMTIKVAQKAKAERIANYPFQAVEEILSNAVYHRSYQIQEPIVVRVTPEGMEITSFPGFDRSISSEAIRNETIRGRLYRNRRIGDFLKELGLIEGRNTGFPNAMKALNANHSGHLVFEMDENRSFLSVTIPVHPAFGVSKKESEYERKILRLLRDEPLTLTELARSMGYKGITVRLSKTMDALVQTKRLRLIVDAKRHAKYLLN